MSEKLEQTKYLRDLRRAILNSFDQEELKVIAIDLSINWDDLSGDTRPTKVQALIMHFARRGELDELVALLHEERSNVDWPKLPSSEQQPLDEQTLNPARRDWVGGDQITTGNLNNVKGTAVGRESQAANIEGDVDGTFIQAGRDVKLGKELRDEQYEIALNWEARSKPSLRGFNLSKRDLSELCLANADLRGANLSFADLRRANLSNADLRRADLNHSIWMDANLSGANLESANLGWADFSLANLSGVNLNDTYLAHSRLSFANLQGANLFCARLNGVSLYCTDLRGANLYLANLTDINLTEAKYGHKTRWSEDFDPKAAGAILVDDEGNPVKDQER